MENELFKDNILRLQEGLSLIRKMVGINATSMGKMLNVTKQAISNLEAGRSKMSMTQYIAIRSIISHQVSRGGIGDFENSVTMYFLIDGYIDGSIAKASSGGDVKTLLKLFSAYSPAKTVSDQKMLKETAAVVGLGDVYKNFQKSAEESGLPEEAAFLQMVTDWMNDLSN